LSQTLCKLTAPGVPDIYQGDEIWDFSLVDPDNRRPVDYEKRRRMLAQLRAARVPDAGAARALVDNLSDGRCKLYLTWKVLQFRREHADLFRLGEYLPLRVSGPHVANLCAFARRHEGELAVVIAPRLYLRLLGERAQPPLGTEVWENTFIELPRGYDIAGGALRNILDGAEVLPGKHGERHGLLAAAALAHFPVAVLHRPAD
ncbi:MAG: malto-oligosyltrehalose synthase, partial [Steroidobacteraceae bacterium]